jgi:hypothetical protein
MASYDYDDLAPEEMTAGSTSYFADPDDGLDPSLFEGSHLKPQIRMFILQTVHDFLRERFNSSETWCRVWIAGSGVSYQWSAAREPGDLDVLLGLNYIEFRHANPSYTGHSDSEIARTLNEDFVHELYPEVAAVALGVGTYEVTIYVNAGVTASTNGINFINPYAAYDCTEDEWAKVPQRNPHHYVHPSWEMSIEADRARGEKIVRTYGDILRQIRGAQNPAHRTNAENNLNVVLGAASGLFEEIHAGRKAAFSPAGHGYSDFANYRWQSGKANGVVHSMRRLKQYADSAKDREDFETYGMELPDTETLIRRASNPRSAY